MTNIPQSDACAMAATLRGALTPVLITTVAGDPEWANPAFLKQTGLDALPDWKFGMPSPPLTEIRQTIRDRRVWHGEDATIIPVLGRANMVSRCIVIKPEMAASIHRLEL